MKKFFVLFLALAMLVPMGLSANAEEAAAEKDPFIGLGWSSLDEEQFPNLDELVTVNINSKGGTLSLSYDNSSNIQTIAEKVKAVMDSRPENMRYLHFFGPARAIAINENNLFADKGVAQLKALFTEFINTYKAIGGTLTGLVIDVEYNNMYAYNLYNEVYRQNKLAYNQIVEDPRYAEQIRPQLVEHGFPFYPNVTEDTPEIITMNNDLYDQYPTAREIWDTVIRNHINAYMNDAFYAPLQAAFPEASMSDYQSRDMNAWLNATDAHHPVGWLGGNDTKVGNVSNLNSYGLGPNNHFFASSSTGLPTFYKPNAYNEAVFEKTAFNMFLYDANLFKNMYASTDTKLISAWITEYNYMETYGQDIPYSVAKTPYYTETILHIGLLDPEPFLVYMYRYKYEPEQYEYCSKILSQILGELTRVVGYSDRKPIEIPATWNSDFVLSGMYANGKNYWRITPNTNLVSVEDFKLEGPDPTFCVSGQTVTFPAGKIIADGKIDEVGTCGYWVETAADVTPVVTNLTDRYAQYPSYSENFDSYADGTQFSATTAKDPAWTLSGKNKPTVSGGALSFTGNATLQNTKVVEKITAGDFYAEQQAWEVTAAIPEGVDGEIVLLNTGGKKGGAKDGGFKIENGKIYYCNAGTYTELADAKAGTYTFRRVVNFTNSEAFTSSYYLLDANGKAVASAKNVAMVTFKVPVTSIAFSTKNLTKTLLLDNYKLYPAGASADLTLYDAMSGKSVESTWTASTAYRLSWMNATDAASKVTVLCDIYEGDKLVTEGKVIAEINRLPGTDSVETGVVEVKEGQSVKVYLQAEAVSDNGGTSPDPEPTVPDDADATDSTLLILTISSVAAAVIIVVLAIVLAKGKKPKASKE